MNNFSFINYLNLVKKLHLESFFSNLTHFESLDQEISKLDLNALEEQSQLLTSDGNPVTAVKPYDSWVKSGCIERQQLGHSLVQAGEVGCVIIAGGQGTRLGHTGPKGTFPISPIKRKSLFQIFSEKINAASSFCNMPLPLAVMTSPLNEEQTKLHFKENKNFGLASDQIDFFNQPMLPFVDSNKKLFRSDEKQIAMGPNGNGSVFEALVESGIYKKWEALGVKYINIILVDNPLADPFDFELIGHLAQTQNDVCLKSCQRKSADEKVGIIVQLEKKPIVIEYHEIPSNWSFTCEPCANLSMLALTMNFAKKMATHSLPLHKVRKSSPYYDEKNGLVVKPSSPNAWKFEKYLFDILFETEKTGVVVYPREDIFSPLKDLKGKNSPKEVQRALLEKERKIFELISQLEAPSTPFELSAEFYYPSKDLKNRWLNQPAISPYLI